jgi:hypothetical protein
MTATTTALTALVKTGQANLPNLQKITISRSARGYQATRTSPTTTHLLDTDGKWVDATEERLTPGNAEVTWWAPRRMLINAAVATLS